MKVLGSTLGDTWQQTVQPGDWNPTQRQNSVQNSKTLQRNLADNIRILLKETQEQFTEANVESEKQETTDSRVLLKLARNHLKFSRKQATNNQQI